MSDTPKTDAFREVIFAQYKEDELTGDGMGNLLSALTDIETLERERDEAREECAKWHGMAIEADKRFVESVLVRDEESKKSRRELDAEMAIAEMYRRKCDTLQEQLDAAIMLGKMQERDFEELIAAAKAVIDRWETPFWKEAAHTGAYIAALRKAVEIASRLETWPNDPEPFESQDHDNDSETYQETIE